MNDDIETLKATVQLVRRAGQRLKESFSAAARPTTRAELHDAMERNEARVLEILELDDAWVVDAVEGNVNHVHGLPGWGVTATLMRDEQPVLTVVHLPLEGQTFTALRGRGAQVNGMPLHVSKKADLSVGIVSTGQAEAGQRETYARFGASVTSVLHHALVVRAMVPSTFPLLLVASGQHEAFWQFAPSLSGIAAGVLLVREAGGVVTRLDGAPWRPDSEDVLVSAPGVHAGMVEALRS